MDVIAYNHHHEIANVEYSIDDGDPESQNEDEDEEIPSYIDIEQLVLPVDQLFMNNGDKTGNTPLRKSLFSNVAPYIVFQSFDCMGPIMPYEVTKYLKWHLSTITPLIVRHTLTNSGFHLMKICQEWCGTWGKHMKSSCFKTLKESQKINHFPGTFQIGRKDCLWLNLNRMMLKHEAKEFDFVPRTYVLPRDLSSFRQMWKKLGGKERWIVKPPASARGTGIKVVHRWSQIPRKRAVIVQHYLSRPKLIDGMKFDLRLYVLVTSFNPLKIYIYPDGLVRFASVKYNDDINFLNDRFMHLTNYSINKTNSTYTDKWALKALWSYLEQKHVNVSMLWASMKDIVVKTMIAGESNITPLTRLNTPSRYCCYELFGFDILLDEDLKPWLLEVNISPSLKSSSGLDSAIKGPLIQAVFNIVGYQLPNSLPAKEAKKLAERYQLDVVCQDNRLYKTTLSYDERVKQSVYSNLRNREEYLEPIIKALTPDDVRQLIVYEDELTQLNTFEKIFPTATSYKYLQYFDVPRYYNLLFDAWETKYAENRSEGIMRLQKLCQQKYHLEQATVC
ncbi:tubulin polyglutamylase TTLL4-like [Bombus vosnesenskii]|uniref:Tubulin polyglutamylase TTLL4-like n=1 Tax=Bombus vosnesenskii TaxID=207650 RepID=A0A6J3LHV2_9HYME|nr:tubulin polyglutamylase TTLL4-like [Bombus vosnesenskii]XP_033364231.1 tubulin polyglutamylase TTLL4-like [Bombus vosnesenskii]XP_033364237.1 tubulin polyglutamylase TTLL4-like [Bombus vosnesenskii]XP_033364246.1 tubulin polyglutamylase TTLL4-like [Bombus vosnesenskii]XP_033364255.1 tubulin polyglutamylase TTLL4-like [Bombus vosnesenskii]